jgi:hypothetical protein
VAAKSACSVSSGELSPFCPSPYQTIVGCDVDPAQDMAIWSSSRDLPEPVPPWA